MDMKFVYDQMYMYNPILLTNSLSIPIPIGVIMSSLGLLTDGQPATFLIEDQSLIENRINERPFVSQQAAADSVTHDPLNVTLTMVAVASGTGGLITRGATFYALKSALDYHEANGGLYTVFTPCKIYTNCVLVSLTCSDPKSEQWTWVFRQPITTSKEAMKSYNAMMKKLSGGEKFGNGTTWVGAALDFIK